MKSSIDTVIVEQLAQAQISDPAYHAMLKALVAKVAWVQAAQVVTLISVLAVPVGKAWVQEDKVAWAVQAGRAAWAVPVAILTSDLAVPVVQAACRLDKVAILTYARAVRVVCHRVDHQEEIRTCVQVVQAVQVATPETCSEIHSNKRNETTSDKERQEATINVSLFILSEIR